MQEARELSNDPSTDYSAAPLEVRSSILLNLLVTDLVTALSRMTYLSVVPLITLQHLAQSPTL